MRQKSVTVDEIMYIAAGHYHLQTGKFDYNMTNPPLMKMLSALPLAAANLTLPTQEGEPKAWSLVEQWHYARKFLYGNRLDADAILFRARLPFVALSILLAWFVFRWSNELYGRNAGLFALCLYSFSPNILAHSRLATQDIGLTALMFISCYYFWRYMRWREFKSLWFAGIYFGLGLLTKTTALFLFPIFSLYALICILRKNGFGVFNRFPGVNRISADRIRTRQIISLPWALCIICLLAVVVVNLGYGFQGSFLPIGSPHIRSSIYEKLPVDNALPKWIVDQALSFPRLLPAPYIMGLQFQSELVSFSGGLYFAGKIYSPGLWYLTIVTILIKTPLSVLFLVFLSSIYFFHREISDFEWLAIIFVSFILFVFSYNSHIGNLLRYVLPIYPVIFLFISKLMDIRIRYGNVAKTLAVVACLWHVVCAVAIYPHYLAYFNEFVGGPKNGYKYLADSNLDWGQDLKGLKAYMDKKGLETIKLAYYGSADASYYGINYDYLPSVGLTPKKPNQYWWYELDSEEKRHLEPQQGMIAVSATLLAGPQWIGRTFHNTYKWLEDYQPIDQVGYSILIYNIDQN